MRIFFSLLFTLTFFTFSFGQAPSNDDCDDPINLGVTPFCDSLTLYNNIESTPSDIGSNNIPSCFKGGASDNDVWFIFTTTTAVEYIFTIQGVPDSSNMDSLGLFNPEAQIYSGICETDRLEAVDNCQSADNGENTLTFSATELQDNQTYFLRINASGFMGVNNGHFYICVEEIRDELSVDMVGSQLCNGRVYDTGGPDSTYSNNEDYIFTICPDDEHSCLTLTMGNYLLETKPNGGDYFKIYDGPDTSGVLIGSSMDMRDTTGKNPFEGINNAVCQEFAATSGCITIYWHTDSSIVSEGFDATWACSPDSCEMFDSLMVDVNPDEDEIIDVLQGRLLTIESAAVECADTAYAIYDGDSTDTGLSKGLLLTTGRADEVSGPNDLPNMGFKNDFPGVELLDLLSARDGDTTTTHDGCSVDMDIRPDTDVMALEFTMGSEEYTECLIDQLTDIMGLFYTTAGFMGDPTLNNHINMARLPGIDTVDIQVGTVTPFDSTTWMFYRNTLGSQSIEYDGMLADGGGGNKFVLLTQNVEPCQANHLIAAIADRADSLYDSGLFLSNIRCLTPTISFRSSLGLNFFIETCNPDEDFLTFTFPRRYDEDTQWDVSFEGQAQEGSDFIWTFGSSITLPAGQESVRLPIDVVDDGIEEGTETFKIKLTRDWGCGEVELTELDVAIRDRLTVEIIPDGPVACKGDTFYLNSNREDIALLNMSWEPASIFFDNRLNRVGLVADEDVRIFLTGTITHPSGCTWTDSFDLKVVDPMVDISTTDPTGICQGESVTLTATDNVKGVGRRWSPNLDISSTTDATVVVTPQRTLTYFVEVDTVGCKAFDTITITVDVLDPAQVIDDATICDGDNIVLAADPGPNTTRYSWTPSTNLDDATLPNPTANPGRRTTYRVVSTSINGYCVEEDSVTIDVIDVGPIVISNPGNMYCNGDTITLSEIALPDSILNKYNVTFNWSTADTAKVNILENGRRSTRVVVTQGGAQLFLTVQVEDCVENTDISLQPSFPGSASVNLIPDSIIVNCADVEATLNLTGTPNTILNPDSITWFFRPEGGEREEFDRGSFTTTRQTNQSGEFIAEFTDDNGCSVTIGRTLEVLTPSFTVPNAFSPNGDMINDVFQVAFEDEDLEYEVRSIRIISRWGQEVFLGDNNMGWDGRLPGGEEAISEVYLYFIEMTDGCGQPVNDPGDENGDPILQGDVTLFR